MSDTRIFKLINLSPIGFKLINYPVQYCSLCHGNLVDVCGSCIEKNETECKIINNGNSFYHHHCYILIKSKINNNQNKNSSNK